MKTKPEMMEDSRKTAELAFGRILRMGARPTQPGDVEEYERCRELIMNHRDVTDLKD